MPDFDLIRVNSLASMVVASPSIVTEVLTNALYARDYTIIDRINVLDALERAANILNGVWEDSPTASNRTHDRRK